MQKKGLKQNLIEINKVNKKLYKYSKNVKD